MAEAEERTRFMLLPTKSAEPVRAIMIATKGDNQGYWLNQEHPNAMILKLKGMLIGAGEGQ